MLNKQALCMLKHSQICRYSKAAAGRARWLLKGKKANKTSNMTPEDADLVIEKVYRAPEGDFKTVPTASENRALSVSVIMPVLNGEKYLIRAIDSVRIALSGIPSELIVVDDGSNDRTKDILERYKKNCGVTVLSTGVEEGHAPSGGPGRARNIGIAAASGEYLMFVDADDFLESNTVLKLLTKVREDQSQIACCNYYSFTEDVKVNNRKTGSFVTDDFRTMCKVNGFPWGKIYHHSLFENVGFPEGYCFQDSLIHWIIFRRCKKMSYCEFYGYGYRANEEGISRMTSRGPKAYDTLYVVEDLIKQREAAGIPLTSLDTDLFLSHVTERSYFRLSGLTDEQKEAFFIHAREVLKKFPRSCSEEYKRLYRIFLMKNYNGWKRYCETMI